jgi:hypothetical protein
MFFGEPSSGTQAHSVTYHQARRTTSWKKSPDRQRPTVWLNPPQPRFTFFHALWLTGVVCTGMLALVFTLNRDWSPFARTGVIIVSLGVGFLVCHFVTFLFVIVLVIPRLGRFTYWAYEVECYMLFVLGDSWRNAGKEQSGRNDSSP